MGKFAIGGGGGSNEVIYQFVQRNVGLGEDLSSHMTTKSPISSVYYCCMNSLELTFERELNEPELHV